jgi:hypothetical protein
LHSKSELAALVAPGAAAIKFEHLQPPALDMGRFINFPLHLHRIRTQCNPAHSAKLNQKQAHAHSDGGGGVSRRNLAKQ